MIKKIIFEKSRKSFNSNFYLPSKNLTIKESKISSIFANGPGDWGSIPGRVIPKTQKMVLNATLFNTQHYKVRIKGKVGQCREWSVVAIEKGAF